MQASPWATRPADDFVAGFVGRDRGYRGLSFAGSEQITVHPAATVVVGQPPGSADERWVLVVDGDGAPRGWLDTTARGHDGPVAVDELRLGGTLLTPGSPLRTALDAVLSSPSGLGVVVDDDGRVRGTVRADEVFTAAGTAAAAGHLPGAPLDPEQRSDR